jgi:two-component system, NarL family, response regulator NreC
VDKIRVLLVDDHSMVREGFRLLLQTQADIEVVGQADDGRSALEQAAILQPDVVLMDITMPELDGLEATRILKGQFPRMRVLAITGSDSEQSFFNVLEAGASGYVLKGGPAYDLIAAVRTAAQGQVFLQPRMTTKLVTHYLHQVKSGHEQGIFATLSDRERQVLQLAAEGYTNQEIASRLIVSASTVQTHRNHAMEKLNLRSRAELIKYAVRKGLIRETDS